MQWAWKNEEIIITSSSTEQCPISGGKQQLSISWQALVHMYQIEEVQKCWQLILGKEFLARASYILSIQPFPCAHRAFPFAARCSLPVYLIRQHPPAPSLMVSTLQALHWSSLSTYPGWFFYPSPHEPEVISIVIFSFWQCSVHLLSRLSRRGAM